MTNDRRDVEVPGAGGVTLRGWWYEPAAAGPHPAVVMAHGFSATKGMGLPRYAEVLRDAGFAVLVYDHRGLGDSDGERQVINPWAQARDLRRALDWVAARTDVDASRLALWGSSFSGGEVLVVGAIDERVRAVVANVPWAGLGGDRPVDDAAFAVLRDALLDESGAGPADATEDPIGPLAVVHDPDDDRGLPVFLPQEESTEWFLDLGRRPGAGWRNEVWLRRAFGSEPAFDPAVGAAHLTVPTLMVVATEDRLAATAVALDTFDRLPGPKEIVMIEGHHFAPYGGEAFTVASSAMARFLREHLAQ